MAMRRVKLSGKGSTKGMFFTISAIILLSVLFASLMFQNKYTLNEQNKIVRLKTSSLQNFVSGLEEDTKKSLYIAGYRSILGAEEAIFNTNKFLNGSKAGILEAVMNGTVQGMDVSTTNQSALPEWLARMQAEAIKLGIALNLSFTEVTVDQLSPWQVDFAARYSFNVTDITSTATFYKNGSAAASVSILGFDDPLYTIFTGNRITRTVNITPYEGNYASGADTSNLISHINGLYYTSSPGPSFLMRLEGNLSDSPVGIESIVRLPDLAAQGMAVYERSSVDYIYFGNATPTIYAINQTFESWFRLDEEHLDKYQVFNLRK